MHPATVRYIVLYNVKNVLNAARVFLFCTDMWPVRTGLRRVRIRFFFVYNAVSSNRVRTAPVHGSTDIPRDGTGGRVCVFVKHSIPDES